MKRISLLILTMLITSPLFSWEKKEITDVYFNLSLCYSKVIEGAEGTLEEGYKEIDRDHFILLNLEITARKKWLELGIGTGAELGKNPTGKYKDWRWNPNLIKYIYFVFKPHIFSKTKPIDPYFITGIGGFESTYLLDLGAGFRISNVILFESKFRLKYSCVPLFYCYVEHDFSILLGYSF